MILDSPFVIFGLSLVVLTLAVRLGIVLQRLRGEGKEAIHGDLGVVTTASLTLLALLTSFSFSMATSRYDQRRTFEMQEARLITVEYFRADLLPAPTAAKVKALLADYVDQRIVFYNEGDAGKLGQVNSRTDWLEHELWTAVHVPALATPNPVTALPVAGVDGVFASRVDAESAFENRIPPTAALLLLTIATCANLLTGLGAKSPRSRLHFILPLLVSIAFFLIADIENPRVGIIRVYPTDLTRAAELMRAR